MHPQVSLSHGRTVDRGVRVSVSLLVPFRESLRLSKVDLHCVQWWRWGFPGLPPTDRPSVKEEDLY